MKKNKKTGKGGLGEWHAAGCSDLAAVSDQVAKFTERPGSDQLLGNAASEEYIPTSKKNKKNPPKINYQQFKQQQKKNYTQSEIPFTI